MTNKFLKQNPPLEIPTTDAFRLFRCDYELNFFHRGLFANMGVRLPASLENAVPKRKAEFLVGRYVAQFALSKLGVEVEEIKIGKHRAPVWPDGIIGSITHTASTVLCAVSVNDNSRYHLGIDLENWIKAETATELEGMIISQVEKRLLLRLGISYSQALTLVFSAKESIFKAFYPSVGDYFGFDAVEIVSISEKRRTFEFIVLESLASNFVKDSKIQGNFEILDKGVYTWIC